MPVSIIFGVENRQSRQAVTLRRNLMTPASTRRRYWRISKGQLKAARNDIKEALCRRMDLKLSGEARLRPNSHFADFVRTKSRPTIQKRADAIKCVFFYETCASFDDLTPHADTPREKNRDTAAKGFRDDDTETLRV